MKIVEIKNIVRKEMPIYYRRFYSGIAVIELIGTTATASLEFQIEHKPTGVTEINVNLSEKVDYPLIPLVKELKNFIGALDSGGKLPN